MDFDKRGYTVVEIPPLDPAVMDEYDTLPLDPYCGGRFRHRRFSQYRLGAVQGQWVLELLPHRPFMQSKEYNRLVGGIPRHFEPLRFDPTPQIAAGARTARLDPAHTYQVNVHQVRVRANREIAGTAVPEGPHRDGHEIGMVAVFRRANCSGGVTQLMPTGGGRPFFETILQPNQAIVYDDAKMWHNATDILPIDDGRDGHRDIWIVAFNRWENRRYGPEFEARAAA